MVHSQPLEAPRQLVTVTGRLDPNLASITDAHNHLWIAAVSGAPAGSPVLNSKGPIVQELNEYRQAGGRAIVDCQPGGCGRDGRVLAQLSQESDVQVVAATGYHLERYYPPEYWLFSAPVHEASAFFVSELVEGLEETRALDPPAQAGFIKLACQKTVSKSPQALMEAAAIAAGETGAALEIHTEKGAEAEKIVSTMARFGLATERIVLCHMDKLPDIGLHRSLAERGVMLEYDTFFRPKYQPEKNVWPLLEAMIANDLWRQVALATDMAEVKLWSSMGGGPGLPGLITHIKPRLESLGSQPQVVAGLLGGNIARRLSRPAVPAAQL